MSLHFVPIWVPTRPPPSLLLSVSARLSYSTDEWAVHWSDLAAVFSAMSFLPTLDCFASHLNAVCSDFYSCRVPVLSVWTFMPNLSCLTAPCFCAHLFVRLPVFSAASRIHRLFLFFSMSPTGPAPLIGQCCIRLVVFTPVSLVPCNLCPVFSPLLLSPPLCSHPVPVCP